MSRTQNTTLSNKLWKFLNKNACQKFMLSVRDARHSVLIEWGRKYSLIWLPGINA